MSDPRNRLALHDLFKKTFSIYRAHFGLFLALSAVGPIAALVYRIERIWRVMSEHPVMSPSQPRTVFDTVIAMSIMASGLIISLAPVAKAVEAVGDAREMKFTRAWSAVAERLWRVVGMALSVFVRAFLAGAGFILAGAFSLGLAAQLHYNGPFEAKTIGFVCGGLAIFAAFAAGIEIYARYALAPQACVIEETTGRVAMRRSRKELTKGLRRRIMAMTGVCILLTFALNLALAFLRVLADRPISTRMLIVDATLGLLLGALSAPVATIGLNLVYFARKEQDASAEVTKARGVATT